MITPKTRNFWENGIIDPDTCPVELGYLLTRSGDDRLRLIRVEEQIVPDEPPCPDVRTDDELGQAVWKLVSICGVNLTVIGVHVALYPERVDQ